MYKEDVADGHLHHGLDEPPDAGLHSAKWGDDLLLKSWAFYISMALKREDKHGKKSLEHEWDREREKENKIKIIQN